MAEAIDKPALGDDLHPGADAGGAGADPHQAKIAILKCFENPANQRGVSVSLKKTNIPGSSSRARADFIIIVVVGSVERLDARALDTILRVLC